MFSSPGFYSFPWKKRSTRTTCSNISSSRFSWWFASGLTLDPPDRSGIFHFILSWILGLIPLLKLSFAKKKNGNLTFKSTHTEKPCVMTLCCLLYWSCQMRVCLCVCASAPISISWVVNCHMTDVTHVFRPECCAALYWWDVIPQDVCLFLCALSICLYYTLEMQFIYLVIYSFIYFDSNILATHKSLYILYYWFVCNLISIS